MSDEGRTTGLLPLDAPGEKLDPLDRASPTDVAEEVSLLITATWTVAARTGSFEPSVREILHEASVSTKAFYRHFRSKDDLLLVALESVSRHHAEYIESKMAAVETPVPRIRAWIEGFVYHVIIPTAALRTMPWALSVGQLGHIYPDEFDKSRAHVIAPLEREIARAAADGSATSSDPAKDARIIFGYTMDAIRQHLIRRTEPDADDVHQLVDFTYRALGVTASK